MRVTTSSAKSSTKVEITPAARPGSTCVNTSATADGGSSTRTVLTSSGGKASTFKNGALVHAASVDRLQHVLRLVRAEGRLEHRLQFLLAGGLDAVLRVDRQHHVAVQLVDLARVGELVTDLGHRGRDLAHDGLVEVLDHVLRRVALDREQEGGGARGAAGGGLVLVGHHAPASTVSPDAQRVRISLIRSGSLRKRVFDLRARHRLEVDLAVSDRFTVGGRGDQAAAFADRDLRGDGLLRDRALRGRRDRGSARP